MQEPNTNIVVRVGDKINSIVCNLAPIACGLFTIASAWAGLSVYGAITFAHVCGRDGVRILRAASPLKLFLAMPVIPLVLVLVRVRVAVRLRVTRHTNGQPVEVCAPITSWLKWRLQEAVNNEVFGQPSSDEEESEDGEFMEVVVEQREHEQEQEQPNNEFDLQVRKKSFGGYVCRLI